MASTSQDISQKEFLRRLYRAANQGIGEVEELVESYPDLAASAGVTPERYERVVQDERRRSLFRRVLLISVSALLILIVLAGLARFAIMIPGVEKSRAELATAQAQNTVEVLVVAQMQETIASQATGLAKTDEPESTETSVELIETEPASTEVPPPTPAYLPAQSYIAPYSGIAFKPELNVTPKALWIMDSATAELEPVEGWIDGTDSTQSKIKYITNVNSSAKWRLDQPLNSEGWFALYVVDTGSYSSGPVDMSLFADGQPVPAALGSGSLMMNYTQTKSPQASAEWLLAGVYPLAYGNQIEVEMRQSGEGLGWYLGVDRVALVQLLAEDRTILETAVSGRPLMGLADDGSAVYEILVGGVFTKTKQDWQTVSVFSGMGGSLRRPTPGFANDVRISWILPGLLPAGKYEALAWIPREHAEAAVVYSLAVNGEEIPGDSPTNGQIKQNNEGAWVSLGLWTVNEDDAKITLRMVVAKDTSVEAAADAVILRKAD